jgi:hypothetical protein
MDDISHGFSAYMCTCYNNNGIKSKITFISQFVIWMNMAAIQYNYVGEGFPKY